MTPEPRLPRALVEAVDDWHTHCPGRRRAIINAPSLDEPLNADLLWSAGIHPWEADKATPEMLDLLRRRVAEPQVVAVGEAGLDRVKGPSLVVQEEVFRAQARIADEAGKPLIIHAVRTIPEIIRLHKEMKPRVAWIIHGFRGGKEAARQLLARPGIYISLGSRYRADAEAVIPPDRLLRESDTDCQGTGS
ncbi:MAG: TatD family hydrolase [Paramuribaculum sp.]|nr:TatD family hydrolase [Paramuribaculum sp.]